MEWLVVPLGVLFMLAFFGWVHYVDYLDAKDRRERVRWMEEHGAGKK
jgi:hypothetical protein